MATKQSETPNFTFSDYVKFFGAGALAATSTHAVCKIEQVDVTWFSNTTMTDGHAN
jgi:solute carrier family 25 phosphate transporter 3